MRFSHGAKQCVLGMALALLGSLSIAQAAALTTAQLSNLGTTQLTSLTTAQIAALSTTNLDSLTSTQFAALTTAQVAAMTTAQVAGLETADLVCLLIDASLPYGHGDEFVIEMLKKAGQPAFLLINKVDIIRKDRVLPLIDKYKELMEFKEIIPISAVTGTNLDVLEARIYDHLPEREKAYADDDITTLPERFHLAELVREKILKHVTMELPFVTAVYIDAVEKRAESGRDEAEWAAVQAEPEETKRERAVERSSGRGLPKPRRPVTYVKASIFVERDNHRKIILGHQGRVIKMIGIEARRELENYLEAKVYLDLQVKVRPEWRDAADVLDLIEGQR